MKRNLLFTILLLLLPGFHQVFAANAIKKVAPAFPNYKYYYMVIAYHPQTSVFLPVTLRCKKW